MATHESQPLPPPSTHNGLGEQEPLLGPRSSLKDNDDDELSLVYNLFTGTAIFAQLGGIALVLVIWISVFTNRLLLPTIIRQIQFYTMLLGGYWCWIFRLHFLHNPVRQREILSLVLKPYSNMDSVFGSVFYSYLDF